MGGNDGAASLRVLKGGGGGERPTGRRGFRPRWPTGGRWWGAAALAAQPGSDEVRWKGRGSLTRGPGEKRKQLKFKIQNESVPGIKNSPNVY